MNLRKFELLEDRLLIDGSQGIPKQSTVEQMSRADFAPDFAPDSELPLSKLTATNNIMLGNHDQ